MSGKTQKVADNARIKVCFTIILLFIVIGPPAGALTWLLIGVLRDIGCPIVGCLEHASQVGAGDFHWANLIAAPIIAAGICFMSYVFGGAQAALVGILCALVWYRRDIMSYALAGVAATSLMVAFPNFYIVGATWFSDDYGLRPRPLADNPADLLVHIDTLAVWLTVNLSAALASVKASKMVLVSYDRDGSRLDFLS